MPLPTLSTLLFALLIALFLGALYHLLRGGGAGHLLAYLFMSVLGFVVGHLVGIWRGWVFFPIGPFNVGMEAAGSLAFLALADWLLHLKPSGENQKEE
jgi:hypothetical protein